MAVERFGLFLRNYDPQTKLISDDIEQAEAVGVMALLSVKLVIDHTLEPEWTVTNSREQEDKRISSNEY